MKNQDQIEKLIHDEWERAKDGRHYICDGCDGIKFIGHLIHLMSGGTEGEKNECLSNRKLDK
jgi:hypothetical protein